MDVTLQPIPTSWEQKLCGEHTCLNTAVWTACDEPDRCTNELCRGLVACDEHAELLGEAVAVMLSKPPTVAKEPYGRRD